MPALDRRLAMLRGGTLGMAGGLLILTAMLVMGISIPPLLALLPLVTAALGVLIGHRQARPRADLP